MNKSKYVFPLSIQTLLPEDYKNNEKLKRDFEILQKYGFSGVELNIAYPERIDYNELENFLAMFGLKLTMFASGLTAKTFNLSLSSDDIYNRNQAVEKILEIISLIKSSDTGIILGFFKGQAVSDIKKARLLFKKSIEEIAPHAETCKVPILIEATNRYESSVANSLYDTFELFSDTSSNSYIKMLPDTFHMNIEEVNMFKELNKYKTYYNSIHFSDNNRFFPGFGAIDFAKVVDCLKSIKYKGGIAIEGNLASNFQDDVKKTMEYLIPILSN
jgi:D-psicose/D-tagatose/L-ribulose 3-epimerase